MISPAQIRAARALINWSQADLVRAARMTPAALSRLESGLAKGRANTLQTLEDIFVQAGVEFMPGNGVRLKQRSVTIVEYEGLDAVAHMQDDVYTTLLCGQHNEMYLSGVDERKFVSADAPYMRKHAKRLQKNKIRQKILIAENDRYFIMPPEVSTYRWIAPEMLGLIPSIVYGSKVAIIFWGPPLQVVIMESAPLAETYRRNFHALWRLAKPVPFTPQEIRDISAENIGG